jgi:uncharacterized protein DUF6843
MLQLTVLRLTVIFAISVGMIDTAACQSKQRRPNRYLIPDGYVGWVRINYRIKEAPVLPIEDGHYLFKFPENGLINTSSEGEEGFASDEYYYYSDDTRRPIPSSTDNAMIWGGVAFGSKTVPGQEPTKYEEFFVGTNEQFEQVGLKCKDSELNPIIGPLEKCLQNAEGNVKLH